MNKLSRRSFVASQTACLCLLQGAQTGSEMPSAVSQTPQAKWPQEVAGIRLPDSKFPKIAVEALLDNSPAYLVNHALRTFYFGALIGRQTKTTCDMELLFLACALHDLGLTPKHAGKLPFEIQGAQAARLILSSAGFPAEKTQIVWDGIAMHPHAMSEFRQPEVALVAAGAGADVVGGGMEGLTRADIQAVLNAFPRLDFKRQFVRTCADIANRYPGAAKRTFMRDIAERTNPAYRVSNICDAIEAAPFTD